MATKYCLWGALRGIQVGSPEDRRLQVHLRTMATMTILVRVMGQWLPALEQANAAFAAMNRSIRRSMVWPGLDSDGED